MEQVLPVLLGQQWKSLQHHSLAEKLQVGMLAVCLQSPQDCTAHTAAQHVLLQCSSVLLSISAAVISLYLAALYGLPDGIQICQVLANSHA